MHALKIRPVQVSFLLAVLFFAVDLIFGVPPLVKKILLPVLLVAMLVLVGRVLYQETRPQRENG